MRTQMQPNVSEMFTEVAQTLETVMQAGIRVQGEAMHWWSELIQKAGTAQQAPRRARSMMLDLLPEAQKNTGRYLSLLGSNYHTGMDLLRRTLVAAGPSASYSEAPKRMLEFWEASMGALRANAHELTQFNARMVDAWAKLAKQKIPPSIQTAQAVRTRSKATPRQAPAPPSARQRPTSHHHAARGGWES